MSASARYGLLAIGLIIAGSTGIAWWVRSRSVSSTGDEDLVGRMISASQKERAGIIVELGKRGPEVIPRLLEAYRQTDEPDLRIDLVNAIARVRDDEAADAALTELLRTERDPEVRRQIDWFLDTLEARRERNARRR